MFGLMSFTASESFDAMLGTSRGPIFGGGAARRPAVGRPVRRTSARGVLGRRRARVRLGGEVIPLGIPVDVTVTPIEISGGWRFQNSELPKLRAVRRPAG